MQGYAGFHRTCVWAALVLLALMDAVSPASINVTVDDQNGDSVTGALPTYSPAGAWQQGATCTSCPVQPSAGEIFDGTWHLTTHEANVAEQNTIQYTFNGTAVYVYFILADFVSRVTTTTNVSFSIDGTESGLYDHIPSPSNTFIFNVPVFIKEGLADAQHVVVISTAGTSSPSLVIFDYLIYTTEDPQDQSSQQSANVTTPTSSVFPISLASTELSSTHSLGSLTKTMLSSATPSSSSTNLTDVASSNNTDQLVASRKSRSGAIAGAVVGALAAIAIVSIGAIYYRRRRRQAFPLRRLSSQTDPLALDDVPSLRHESSAPHLSQIEKDPYSSIYSFGDEKLVPYGNEKEDCQRHSLPPSLYGYGVGLQIPNEPSHSTQRLATKLLNTPDPLRSKPLPQLPTPSADAGSSRRTERRATPHWAGRGRQLSVRNPDIPVDFDR